MPAKATGPAPAGFMWIDDAAKALGVEVCTLYKWRQKRKGPASFKHAGRLMYRESAIAAHFEACEAADSHSNPQLSPLNRVPQPRVSGRRSVVSSNAA